MVSKENSESFYQRSVKEISILKKQMYFLCTSNNKCAKSMKKHIVQSIRIKFGAQYCKSSGIYSDFFV